jgi:hypothetical protein
MAGALSQPGAGAFFREVMPLDGALRGWPETPKAGAPGLTQRAQEEVRMRGTQEERQSKDEEAAETLHQRAGHGSRRDAGMAGLGGRPIKEVLDRPAEALEDVVRASVSRRR